LLLRVPNTSLLLEGFRERDRRGDLSDAGRTKLLLYGSRRPICVVLFHGMTASPQQFDRYARALHSRGYNVIVPRLPRHGRSNRLSDALASLRADQLRACAQSSVELARELGDRIVVAGFSLGGLLTTWIAQRYDVARAVAIAPFFGMPWLPSRLTGSFANLLLSLPNFFGWWDPVLRERQLPEHGYPRYASHGIAQTLLLVRDVWEHAAEPIAAREFVAVANSGEVAVNNRMIRRLASTLQPAPGGRIEHVVLPAMPPSHDIIEPLRHPALAERIFPRLLAIIGEPPFL
jgi:pimeloyl-ACP methyl ester carboxylesterase